MDDHDLSEYAGGAPSLVSLALFALAFFAALLVVEFGGGLIDPIRAALAELPASLKTGALAAFILGVMAIARIAVLLGSGFRKGTD
jgi:hypothetical protein